MPSNDGIFQGAMSTLLTEVFDGPPGDEAYILNPGDPGLLRQLDTIDAKAASSRPMPGSTTVAAHVDHVCYGLSLLNRWIAGEANPWATADWKESWKRGTVTPEQWASLRTRFRDEAARWKKGVAERTAWDHISAAGSISSVAHTAYHLGAIRQILSAMELYKPS
ncbi:hypothetical protein VT03_16725 [Planctomyces sp. SH-PL14]|nr:hypothetical protein VT03_16725 [Planctomyces sp. SH-PL14]